MKNVIKIMTVIVVAMLTVTASAQDPQVKFYLSISHEIADYPDWRIVFDKLNPDRMKAGIADIFVKKNINNTNSITIFSEVKDVNKAKAFMSGTKIQEAMAKAGVVSTPEIIYYKSAKAYETINTAALVTTITHRVANFSAWKVVYESAEKLRRSADVNDHLLLRSLSDENVITVLGTSPSAAKFNKFMSNPNLQATMEKAGVLSKPEVAILL